MNTPLGSKPLAPGIRFYPTDEEICMFYLKRKVLGKSLGPEMMSEVDVFRFDPWDLPGKACLKTKDLYWWFICPRVRKYPNGGRFGRSTANGYWKATGNDKVVSYRNRTVGKIKTFIFHLGKPLKGDRTDWVIHEYRLEDGLLLEQGVDQESYAICKIYEKSGLGPRNGEQYGAPFVEEEWDSDDQDNLWGSVLTSATDQDVSTPSTELQQPEAASGDLILPPEGPIPSTTHPPDASGGFSLPQIETEFDDEIDSLLAMFTNGDAIQDPDSDIFKGLDDLSGGYLLSDPGLDWTQILSDDCYMELNDLQH